MEVIVHSIWSENTFKFTVDTSVLELADEDWDTDIITDVVFDTIREQRFFPDDTVFKMYFYGNHFWKEDFELRDDIDSAYLDLGLGLESYTHFRDKTLVVRGFAPDGTPLDFATMVKSANKTASTKMIREALVLHKGDPVKASSWLARRLDPA